MPEPAAVPGRERAWTQASERELVREPEQEQVAELVREPEQVPAAKELDPEADSG